MKEKRDNLITIKKKKKKIDFLIFFYGLHRTGVLQNKNKIKILIENLKNTFIHKKNIDATKKKKKKISKTYKNCKTDFTYLSPFCFLIIYTYSLEKPILK